MDVIPNNIPALELVFKPAGNTGISVIAQEQPAQNNPDFHLLQSATRSACQTSLINPVTQ